MIMRKLFASVATSLMLVASIHAAPKTYQVTGPIIDLTDKTIVVEKNNERWEIAREEATKINGELKVGQKVTIHYRMTATTIESKEPQEKKRSAT